MKKIKGFTLMELIIVISIIGIIITLSIISLGGIRRDTNDTKKISDIKQIQSALELYRANEGHYPETLTPGQPLISSSTNYMVTIPSNSETNSSDTCVGTNYTYTKKDNGYTLDFCLNKASGNLDAGPKCATPSGILNQNCFMCGEDQLTLANCDSGAPNYEKCVYDTVKIGDQCWTKQNLNIGTRVDGFSIDCIDIINGQLSCQVNPSVTEKYCYNNDDNNCLVYGGLYEWSEAMKFPYECNNADFSTGSSNCGTGTTYTINDEHQGLCPSGWHVANKNDITDLYSYLGGISIAGGKLKETGTTHWTSPNTGADNSSGFTALPGGYRNYNGSFFSGAYNGIFTLSNKLDNVSINTNSMLDLGFNSAAANDYGMYRVTGLAIRCVQN
ncbi:MAG: FISUMP domain-containing protein [Candidatus Falkowbacteria bacterium]